MKSLDIVVMCKLFILQNKGDKNWTYAKLAKGACLSVGEVHASVRRLKKSGLFDELTKSVIPQAMEEFLIHGVKYAFPSDIGTLERGISTSHSAQILKGDIVQSEKDVYVWPYAKGRERGLAVDPLSRSAPKAALKDELLYGFLALVDALRIGRAREKNLAAKKLRKMMQTKRDNVSQQ